MYICSTVPGNECQLMPIETNEFNDVYECTVYGYDYSHKLMASFDPDWTNSMEAYTKFSCEANQII